MSDLTDGTCPPGLQCGCVNSSRTGASARPSYVRRRRAKLVQHPLAQSFGIALAGIREIHDLPSQHVIGEVAAIGKPEGDQGHLKCKAHDPDRIRVELLAVEVEPDGDGARGGTSGLDRTYGTFSIFRRYGSGLTAPRVHGFRLRPE